MFFFPKLYIQGFFYGVLLATGFGLLVGGIAGKFLFGTILDMQLENVSLKNYLKI